MKFPKIKFKGKEYILTNNEGPSAITTIEAFRGGTVSYAHLYEDGYVIRYGMVIGTEKDIERIGEVEINSLEPEATFNLLTRNTWGKKDGLQEDL